MFSRSDKSDEMPTTETPEAPKQRSPMVMAVVAGALALAGAFSLVLYLSGSGDEAAESADEAALSEQAVRRQVLLVTETIPAGTPIGAILADPQAYLTARTVPEDLITPSAIETVEALREFDGLSLASDVTPGNQLQADAFIDRSTFEAENFAQRAVAVAAPEGHHQVVVSLPANRALGGLIRGGDEVSVVGSFLLKQLGASYNVSMVVLPSIEVLSVETTSAAAIGQVAADAETVGTASSGTYVITLAVEPDELTDLTYTMENGEIILAVALEDQTKESLRPATTISTLLEGAELNLDEIRELLEAEAAAASEASGDAEEDAAADEATTDEATADEETES